jgi:hypothetical protein
MAIQTETEKVDKAAPFDEGGAIGHHATLNPEVDVLETGS